MMFWQEDEDKDKLFQVPDDIVDINYRITARTLPLDHAYALSSALLSALPWLAEEASAGIHLIHGAESGNGWYRPEDVSNELLHLSRRARMTLRIPKSRIADAETLTGTTLEIDGHPLEVGESNIKKLSPLPTLFARYVKVEPGLSEADFLHWAAEQIKAMGIPVSKLMAGKSHAFNTPDGTLHTRSLMIADLEPESAVTLQQEGLGEDRKLGCGLFIPHKGIKPVKEN